MGEISMMRKRHTPAPLDHADARALNAMVLTLFAMLFCATTSAEGLVKISSSVCHAINSFHALFVSCDG